MPKLYNTRTKQKEQFKPICDKSVGLYTCGPTVYNYAHIGNLRTYIFEDLLKRVLKMNGYLVNHVMNITDVGHLTDDADYGEDKMEKGAKREGRTAWDIADFYTKAFKNDIAELNILEPSIWCIATDHIPQQIEQVQTLINKGFTYETSDGIYFDTTKLEDYGKLANLKAQELRAGERVDMGEKKNPHDFALWKFTKEGETRQMEWDAFGRKGFPGWHIECSAMSMKYLGNQFDIHCGGIDHVPVHHTNEIAQAEACSGVKPWVNVWMHGEFLVIGEDKDNNKIKMAKSGDNFITLQTLKDRGYSPLAYRYYLLQAHYRKQLAFSWEAMDAAASGLKRLKNIVQYLPEQLEENPHLEQEFFSAVNDDLNIAEALGVLWRGIKEEKLDMKTVIKFDKVLGLNLHEIEAEIDIPENVQLLLDERVLAREEKNWELSDKLRDEIASLGFKVEDSGEGQEVRKL